MKGIYVRALFGFGLLSLLTFSAGANPFHKAYRSFATAPSTGITSFNSNFTATHALAGPAANTISATNVGNSGWDFSTTTTGSTNVSITVAAGGPNPGGAADFFIRCNSGTGTIPVGSVSVKSDDGSLFDLLSFYIRINMAPSSTTNVTVTGYRGGTPVPGATLTLSGITTNNSAWHLMDVSSNFNFGTLDEFVITQTGTNAIVTFYGIDQIDLGAAALPLTLTDFSGQKENNNVQLQWTTGSEQNTDYFEVERGLTSTDFQPIGRVAAAGNSNSTKQYQYTDISPAGSSWFYRLIMVDLDGKFTYSPILHIGDPPAQLSLSVYPNPIGSSANLLIGSPDAAKGQLFVRDISGKTLLTESLTLPQGSTLYTLPLAARLPKGVYWLTVVTRQGKQSVEIIKGD